MPAGRFWTTGELDRLTAMVGRYPVWHIAMRLDRTVGAARSMCRNLGISYRQAARQNQNETIEQMAGLMPAPAIAWKLECSTSTIQKRARALGISLRMIHLGIPRMPAKKPRYPGITYIRGPGLIRKRWKARPGGEYIGYFATEAEAQAAIMARNGRTTSPQSNGEERR